MRLLDRLCRYVNLFRRGVGLLEMEQLVVRIQEDRPLIGPGDQPHGILSRGDVPSVEADGLVGLERRGPIGTGPWLPVGDRLAEQLTAACRRARVLERDPGAVDHLRNDAELAAADLRLTLDGGNRQGGAEAGQRTEKHGIPPW